MSGHTQGEMDFGPGESGPYHGERAPERDPRGRRPKARHSSWRIKRTVEGSAVEYWTYIEGRDEQGRYTFATGWTTDASKAHCFPTWNQANTERKKYHIDPDAITEDTGISY